jgi:tetratricopeptide (TPR) repeat protein
MGDAFSFLNNPKKALEYYKLALEKGNSRFYAGITLHKLALHHYREGNFNEAKEACRELLKKNVGHHHGQVLSELLKMMETRNNE